MPKLQNPSEESSFLAGVNASLHKVHNKAKQTRKAYEEKQDPDYWQKQRQRMQNPRVKSYDALTEWVSV